MKMCWAVLTAGVLVASGLVITLASCQSSELMDTAVAGWKEDFDPAKGLTGSLPRDWQLFKKPGTPPAEFAVVAASDGSHNLHLEAEKASASIITQIQSIDLTKTPILRWRWRATELPRGGDGRVAATDDQAIGIYVGTGSMLKKKSISYRWDTETPKGAEGNVNYGGGTIKVKWFTLRNKQDAQNGQWVMDERNFLEDFMQAYGFRPDKIYISISCNSQYTGTNAAADLDWIELVSVPNSVSDK